MWRTGHACILTYWARVTSQQTFHIGPTSGRYGFPYRPDIRCRYRSTIGCATRLQIGPMSAQCINTHFCRHYADIPIWVFISVTGLFFISARCRVLTSVLHLISISARYRMPISVHHRMCNSATDRTDIGSMYKYAVLPTLYQHTDLSFYIGYRAYFHIGPMSSADIGPTSEFHIGPISDADVGPTSDVQLGYRSGRYRLSV